MSDDARQTMKELATVLFTLPVRNYLESEAFSYFCHAHDLWDPWREYLRHAQDRPDLYGAAVLKHAFTDFLYHWYHGGKEGFLSHFTLLIADFSRSMTCPLPTDDLRRSMLLLGYSEAAIDHAFFNLHVRPEATREEDHRSRPPKGGIRR